MLVNFKDILEEFYTPEELDRVEELTIAIRALDQKTQEEHPLEFQRMKEDYPYFEGEEEPELPEWKAVFWDKRLPLEKEYNALFDEAKRRYKEAKGDKGILEDIRRIVEAYTREDYLQHIKNVRLVTDLEKLLNIPDKEKEALLTYLKEQAKESFVNCYLLIYEYLKEALQLLEEYDSKIQAKEIIEERISLWYTPERGADRKLSPYISDNDKLIFSYPTEYYQNLTKVSNRIFDSSISLEDLKQVEIDISPNKKGLTTTYSVNVDLTAPELKGTENITKYDKSVHDMAVSIAIANEHGCFTAKQLATALYHGNNPKNSNPSKQQIGAVTKSIEKQRHVDLTIDWTEHAILNNKGNLPEEVTAYRRKGYMLPVEEHIFTVNGQELNGYQFIKEPPLYQYARNVGQIGKHPIEMLDVPINLDEDRIILRDFLLEEIAHLKNKTPNWNNTISVERLLKEVQEDVKTINRVKKKRLLDAVEEMLKYWKERGDIKGYTKNTAKTTGSPLQSITIDV